MILDIVDTLLDRFIQLLTYKAAKRAALLGTHVTPAFEEFERIHSAYLESFGRYRELIRDTQNPAWLGSLQATLERDNLFSAGARAKVVRLAEAADHPLLGAFITETCGYLMGARLVDSLGKAIQPTRTQRWRQSLFRTLDRIAEERWQLVLDADGARPPLSPEEMESDLARLVARYEPELQNAGGRDGRARACALSALDGVVTEMQFQYDQVCQAYLSLKAVLSK